MLPADVIGTQIYNPQSGQFTTRKGPIFANLVLADEINRAPAKVQSALLEAMQEKQVTIGEQSFKLEEPFLVLATQNPIEQEGTYPLPEAQVDRFMLKLKIGYPSREEERQILDLMARTNSPPSTSAVVEAKQILGARQVINDIYIDDKVKDYIVDLVCATRSPLGSFTAFVTRARSLRDAAGDVFEVASFSFADVGALVIGAGAGAGDDADALGCAAPPPAGVDGAVVPVAGDGTARGGACATGAGGGLTTSSTYGTDTAPMIATPTTTRTTRNHVAEKIERGASSSSKPSSAGLEGARRESRSGVNVSCPHDPMSVESCAES